MAVTNDVFPEKQDERIREDVSRQIAWQPEIESRDISIKVQDANVFSLVSYMRSWRKPIAEKAAKSVFGVRSVANDIEVRPKARRTDPEIARDGTDNLRLHASVPDNKLKVWWFKDRKMDPEQLSLAADYT